MEKVWLFYNIQARAAEQNGSHDIWLEMPHIKSSFAPEDSLVLNVNLHIMLSNNPSGR